MIFGGLTKSTLIDYPGKMAAMVYTIGCNFRCPYCHNPELVDETVETTFDEETVLTFLTRRQGLLDGLVITGGEPTMHGEELKSFIRKVRELGFLIKLDTNGTNPAFLKSAIKEGLLDYIAMDIKSPLRAYHETVGRPVNTNDIEESINILRSGKVPYEFRTTVVKSLLSPEDLGEIFKTVAGASRYYLQKFIPTNTLNAQFRRKVSYSDEEFEEFQKRAEQYVQYCGIR